MSADMAIGQWVVETRGFKRVGKVIAQTDKTVRVQFGADGPFAAISKRSVRRIEGDVE